jgi:CheY-like chemotaxis protein
LDHVLIVDDEESVRKPLRILLEHNGYGVQEAANGAEALQLIRTSHIDAVITDVVMPVQGGLETVMAIHQEFPNIGLVVMSGKIALDADSIRILTKQFGASRLLNKPFTKSELLESVSEALHAS